ncbi:LamG domain-containing protein [Micromonospora taraxaci]|uniref:LamG domain-containing protein n=1 Tax=Micromonospora taraxaci TaxID=1316803 RepID=UPI0033B87608
MATPEGSLVLESYATPRWKKRTDASGWWSIDTALQRRPDGTVAPGATLADVVFSAGGTAPAVTLPVADSQVSLTWPDALPEPRIEGDAAVYDSVLPQVDLRLRALVDGFTWVLVVKSAQAAANPALETLRFRLDAPGLTTRERASEGFEVVDSSGQSLLSAGDALMWDSSGAASSVPAAKAGAAARVNQEVLQSAPDLARTAELPVEVQGSDLVIRPDLSLLRDDKTVFPVMIDPWSTFNKLRWGYAGSENATRDDGVARVGSDPNGSGLYRSFFAFNLSSLSGKTVRSAKFLTEMTHSAACTSTPVNLWRSADLTTSGKQTWDGPNLAVWLDERSGHAHKPSGGAGCSNDPQPDLPMEFSGGNLNTDVSAARGDSNYTVVLSTRKSDGSSESTSTWWKKFDPAVTKLSVEYNSNPNTPTAAQLSTHAGYTGPAQACVTGASRPMVRSDYPWLKATVSDPDGSNGGSLSGVFTLQKLVGGAWTALQGWPKTDSGVAPGAKAEVQVSTATVDGDVYRWQVQTKDTLGGASTGSPWCEFYVDYSAPGQRPKVTAIGDDPYLEAAPGGTNQTPQGSVGLSGKFTFSANGATDVYDYVYKLGNGPEMTVQAATLGGSADVWVTPTVISENVLTVRSRDRAGNSSETYDYKFLVLGYSAPKAVWKMDEGTGSTAATTPAGGPSLALTSAVGWSESWVHGTRKNSTPDRALGFGTNKGWAATSTAPPIDSSRSFSVAAWARVISTNTFGSVVAVNGTNNGAWQLQRDKGGNWYFHTFSADSSTHSRTSVASSTVAPIGVWQHIAGVYDAGAKEIRIYVNGQPAGTQALSSLWKSTGILQVGRVRYNAVESNYFDGDVDEIQLWDRVVDQIELQEMLKPKLVGEWILDDLDLAATSHQQGDSSGYNRPVNLTAAPSATICEGQGPSGGNALCLDGSSGTATTAGQLLRTEGSWTVAAWVKPAAFTSFHTVLSQCGVSRCAFYLQRQAGSSPGWAIVVPDRDQPEPNVSYTTVKWGDAPILNQWVHLAATYDPNAKTLKLYVNGAPVGIKENMPPLFASTGSLRIGSSDSGDYVNGALSTVRVWQGALTDVEVLDYANQL